jgi:hypothetical protein
MAVVGLLFATAGGTASAAQSPPWSVISRGGGTTAVPGGGTAGGVLIGTRRRLEAFALLTMHPGHLGCCEWYETFDWQHRVVLLVVARLPYEFAVSGITRRRSVLRVWLAPRSPGQPDFGTPFTTWEALSVPRSVVGRSLPRRIVVTAS